MEQNAKQLEADCTQELTREQIKEIGATALTATQAADRDYHLDGMPQTA